MRREVRTDSGSFLVRVFVRGREALCDVCWGSLTGRIDHSIGKYVGIVFKSRECQWCDDVLSSAEA